MKKFSTLLIKKPYSRWFLERLLVPTENNSATLLMSFGIKSSVMDIWYLVSLVTYVNWLGFLENFLASSSLQNFQVKLSRNGRELKWLILWQAITEYLEKSHVFNRANDRANFIVLPSLWSGDIAIETRGFWNEPLWSYWPKKLLNLTKWGSGKILMLIQAFSLTSNLPATYLQTTHWEISKIVLIFSL